MSALIYYVTIVVGFVALICFYLKRKYSYWSNRNVPGPTPIWLLGNMHQQLTSNVQQLDVEWMKKYGKLYGTYIALTPVITIADPELIKQTIIKDFHYFVNRIDINSYHELWNTNLFVSKDDSWKRIRTIASPSFTSGKLRAMASIMRRSIDNLDQYLKKMSINENKSINVKQTIAGFTIDVIASTAFATDTNANSEEDNPLVVNGRKMMDFPIFRAMSTFLFPKPILDFLGIHYLWDPKYFSFFIDLTTHIVKKRRAECNGNNQIKHHDLIQLMMDANVDEEDLQKFNYEKMIANDDKEITTEQSKQPENDSRKRKLTDVEVISNCIFFFMAGYETTSSTISHCIYELAKNQSIQNRLFKDLKETLNDLDESSDEYFDKVMTGIPYLEAVIKETLRRYAPLSQINRVCTKDGYQLGNIKLSAGQVVVISIVSVHMNPEYYPEPQTFNPDRFMPENRDQLVPYAYMPFALGPRNCLAMRFAYQEIKLCLARIIRKFRFERNEGTPDQLSYKIGSGLLNSKEFSVKAIEIVPNRQYLSYKDDRIQFDCIDPNMMPMNNGSIVTFMIAGKLVYDSSINYLGPGVTKLSSNSIVTTSITGGIVNAICTINGMASPPIPIIPYVSTVSFDVNRTELEIGQIFEAKCDFIVTPLALTTFNVSFVKDQSIVIGQYRVVDRNAIWTRPEIVEGIDIANGKVTTTQWGVIIDPKSDESNGIYGCEVSLPHPHESIIFRSNEWNANSNGCNTVKNSWFIILLSIMIAIIMVKH